VLKPLVVGDSDGSWKVGHLFAAATNIGRQLGQVTFRHRAGVRDASGMYGLITQRAVTDGGVRRARRRVCENAARKGKEVPPGSRPSLAAMQAAAAVAVAAARGSAQLAGRGPTRTGFSSHTMGSRAASMAARAFCGGAR
jgi:hypothetical protein